MQYSDTTIASRFPQKRNIKRNNEKGRKSPKQDTQRGKREGRIVARRYAKIIDEAGYTL